MKYNIYKYLYKYIKHSILTIYIYIYIYEVHTISFQTFFVWGLLIVHT